MSTIVINENERERRFTNEINRSVRRCKIGKVTVKAKSIFKSGWFPQPNKPIPAPFFNGGFVHTDGAAQVVINPIYGVTA